MLPEIIGFTELGYAKEIASPHNAERKQRMTNDPLAASNTSVPVPMTGGMNLLLSQVTVVPHGGYACCVYCPA